MKKKIGALLTAFVMLFGMSGCSLPIIGDFIESENSLGKTNNTAVTIAAAMPEFLKAKRKSDLVLYGVEMVLNEDSNGIVKLYYTGAKPNEAEYSDIFVAEVDSKTGHVERFETVQYAEDGITPYEMVKNGSPIDVPALPIDSGKAISAGAKAFSGDLEYHYDYIHVLLHKSTGLEQYEIRFISMLNDQIYYSTVDGVSGALIASSVGALE